MAYKCHALLNDTWALGRMAEVVVERRWMLMGEAQPIPRVCACRGRRRLEASIISLSLQILPVLAFLIVPPAGI